MATRLTLWYAAATFVLVLGVTAYLYLALSRSLDREDDEFLEDQVAILRGILRDRPGDRAALQQEVEWESVMREYAKTYVRILDAGGNTLAETPGMPSELGPRDFPAPARVDERGSGGVTLRRRAGAASRGCAFRVLAAEATVGPGDGERRVLQVALDREAEEDLLARFRALSAPLLAASLVICGIVGHRIAKRGLDPLRRISAAVALVRPATLRKRIAAEGWPAELSSLAAGFNGMLERLEDAFQRISRFSADIAHELRTPLNNLRGEVEVALGRERSPAEYREVLASFLEEAQRLSRMVESLLFLARAERPETRVERSLLDARKELEGVREFYEAAACEAGIALEVEGVLDGDIFVEGDRTLLQRALGNLVENALAHTPPGGRIVLGAVGEADAVRISVADTGAGIPADHLPHVFERLYRADPARGSKQGGAGLGLSIVKSIAELHGGTVGIESSPQMGTSVTLRIPKRRGLTDPAPSAAGAE